METELNPENVLGKIEPQEMEGLRDPIQGIRDALGVPNGSPRLKEIVSRKKPAKVVIIVNE